MRKVLTQNVDKTSPRNDTSYHLSQHNYFKRNLIDKVPLVSNTTLVSCIAYWDKANPNNGNSKADLVPKHKESQYITIDKNNYLLTKAKDKQNVRELSHNLIEGAPKSRATKQLNRIRNN